MQEAFRWAERESFRGASEGVVGNRTSILWMVSSQPRLPLYCKPGESRNRLAPQIMEVADKVGEMR